MTYGVPHGGNVAGKPTSDDEGKVGNETLAALKTALEPLEGGSSLHVFTDNRTGARYCECHVRANKLTALGTTDTPLDPDEQPEYRANRDLVENAPAFTRMKDDAGKRRSFSGIVMEFIANEDRPLKVIGGQHRFTAVEEAFASGVDELHGVKIYLDLTMEQRFDAQLISNTVIAISRDLFDRMHETRSGPQLRNWCHEVGLLPIGEDFADRRVRGGTLTVQAARTFITAYYTGAEVDPKKFATVETTPSLLPTGSEDTVWMKVKVDHPTMWEDAKLLRAGKEYARLVTAQRSAFSAKKLKIPVDFPEKAGNLAIMAAWAFVAGVLRDNETRLRRHYSLPDAKGKDPLNATALAKGRHKTDQDNYRGLGYRVDAKERGRLTELFFLQAESGEGLAPTIIDLAIKKYYAKQAVLEVTRAEAKAEEKATEVEDSQENLL